MSSIDEKEPELSTKKKRGRPRKDHVKEELEPVVERPKIIKKRGRPPRERTEENKILGMSKKYNFEFTTKEEYLKKVYEFNKERANELSRLNYQKNKDKIIDQKLKIYYENRQSCIDYKKKRNKMCLQAYKLLEKLYKNKKINTTTQDEIQQLETLFPTVKED